MQTLLTERGELDPAGLKSDFLSLLGIDNPFAVDGGEVRQYFLRRCRDVHPDFHPDQRELAEGLSARLNEAWKTFQDRQSWLEYLILRRGGRCAQTDKTTRPETLLDMLAYQEKVEATSDEKILDKIRQEALTRRNHALDAAFAALQKDDFTSARLELNEARYCRTLLQHLDAKETG